MFWADINPDSKLRSIKPLIDTITSGSPYLRSLLLNNQTFAQELINQAPENVFLKLCKSLETLALEDSRDVAMHRLRQTKQQLALLVALCDVGNVWSLTEVTSALTQFADTAVESALQFLWKQDNRKALKGYVVLAMGKMGAHELNYSSDIDLIVLYDSENSSLAKKFLPETYFVKLTRNLASLLQDVTEDSYVFRVDLRLRPDPRATQVAIDIEAAANYYENYGQNWERAAMIKARPCAGDTKLGEEFLDRLQPYIWRKYLDYAAIADVQSMKRQIHAVKGHSEIAVYGHNLKLGRGGIREIEFFVQTQQLIAGGRNPKLRGLKTLEMLDVLADEKWITPIIAADMKQAYEFLRGLEHRAQMCEDQQTHDTPSDSAAFETYAKFCGFENADALATKLRATLQTVQNHYAALFESAENLSGEHGNLVFTGGEDDPATLETLSKLGFTQSSEISATIRAWHFGRYRATKTARARELLTELMPFILKTLAQSGEADRAFFAFDKFLESLPAGIQLLAMIKANPRILDLIAEILGSAPRLAEKISSQPRILEAVTAPDFFDPLPEKSILAAELNVLIPNTASIEDAMDLARVFAREKNFRVGVRILSETISAEAAGQGFSEVADVLLAKLLIVLKNDIMAKHGIINGGTCVILGLGKLGGHEMTAASDLDIMLIYDHPEAGETSNGKSPLSPGQYYSKLTQKLVTAITAPTAEGKLFDVDMRLRPSGSTGPLAVSQPAFETYQEKEAWTWERMALTRARVICGDEPLAKKIEANIKHALSIARDPETIKGDVAKMRALMLREHKSDGLWDLKRARGGQVEIEFIAQYLQLLYAKSHPEILNASTFESLKSAAALKVLEPQEGQILLSTLSLYQRLTHILRLCLDGLFDAKTAPAHLNASLAQAAGLPNIQATQAHLIDLQTQVDQIFSKMIGR